MECSFFEVRQNCHLRCKILFSVLVWFDMFAFHLTDERCHFAKLSAVSRL